MFDKIKIQLEVALLGIIALLLIYQTYRKFELKDASAAPETTAPAITGNQTSPQQPRPFQPATNNQSVSAKGNPVPRALMNFDQTEVDLGMVPAGKKVRHTFTFTNTGQVQLLIQEVSTDEGLFIISRPRDPIPPGGTGEILCELLDNIPPGPFEKVIHINSNANPNHIHLQVKANIVAR
ncbi:MAG: DUF1573 domain-containing protein [Flavobacteriales bacterium]